MTTKIHGKTNADTRNRCKFRPRSAVPIVAVLLLILAANTARASQPPASAVPSFEPAAEAPGFRWPRIFGGRAGESHAHHAGTLVPTDGEGTQNAEFYGRMKLQFDRYPAKPRLVKKLDRRADPKSVEFLPPRIGRDPRSPGSPFDPGATGPGVSTDETDPILGGAFDPRSGWPFVLAYHLKPRESLTERFWIVNTYKCKQELSLDSWQGIGVRGFNAEGVIVERKFEDMWAAVAGRPVVIQVHGSLTYFDAALASGLWTQAWLSFHKAVAPDTVFIIFDWPSWRIFHWDVRDVNEKGRRALIAGLHLAQLTEMFPASSRITLLGQSYGGRVVATALHLLGGGALEINNAPAPVRLRTFRPDLQLQAILIAAAIDHDWILPGKRLGNALTAAQAVLNLHNRHDQALLFYPLLLAGGHRAALGRRGLSASDMSALGPYQARFRQGDVTKELGAAHTLLDAIGNPLIARRMAPYFFK